MGGRPAAMWIMDRNASVLSPTLAQDQESGDVGEQLARSLVL